jgi:hypothetical protein
LVVDYILQGKITMPHPENLPGTRICIAVTRDGVTVYGNQNAMKSLARQLDWIAEADPKEHCECHVVFHMSDEESAFEKKVPRNITVLVERELFPYISKRGESVQIDSNESKARGFELTFMAAPENELDKMSQNQDSGLLPEGWNSEG